MKKVMALLMIVNIILMGVNNPVFAGEYQAGLNIEYNGKVVAYQSKLVTLKIDGNLVLTGDMPALIIDSRTLVPAREVFESSAIGAVVQWNAADQSVNITYKNQVIVLNIGSNVATVNGNAVVLDVPANLIRDMSKKASKTMIPLRFVTQSLGFTVNWNNDTFTADITSPSPDLDNSVDSEKLEGVNSEKAKRTLPTALSGAPVVWTSEGTANPTPTITSEALTSANNPEVSIDTVAYSEGNGLGNFSIMASGAISTVQTTSWDNKFIVDIHGARFALDGSNKTYNKTFENNPMVLAVRSSDYGLDQEGKKVVRVVFDLKNATESFSLTMSPDRKTLYYGLGQVVAQKQTITLAQNEIGDYVEFTGIQSGKAKTFRLSNPNRIVLDFADTSSQMGKQSQLNTQGQYVTSIRTAQFDATTTRIVLETDGQADYEISQTDTSTTRIQLMEPSYENIQYTNEEHPIITLENASQIVLSDVTYEDRYNNNQFIIHLPGNYANVFGEGGLQVDDASVDSIDIVTNELGNTDLIIHEKDIYVFRVESDGDRVFIRAYKPKEIYSQIVVLDFGHGGKDPGAIGKGMAPGGGNLQEKDVNLAIGNFTRAYLEADPNIKVYYTRQDDTYIPLQTRTDIGNKVQADFFVSIHNNANDSPSIAGSETLYFKDADRPGLNSIELARILQKHVVAAIGLFNRGVKDDNGLFILRNSTMPAIILEEGFVTNVNDSKKLGNPVVQDAIAKAIYEGIVETFAQYPTGRSY